MHIALPAPCLLAAVTLFTGTPAPALHAHYLLRRSFTRAHASALRTSARAGRSYILLTRHRQGVLIERENKVLEAPIHFFAFGNGDVETHPGSGPRQ